MKCSTCEGENIIVDDGVQLCNNCGTVVENSLQQESQEFFKELDRSRIVRLKKQYVAVTKEVTTEKTTISTVEAYNIILHAWTKAMCNLGASSRFKQIIFELWVLYLHRSKIAFLPEDNEEAPNNCIKSKPLAKFFDERYTYFSSEKSDGGSVPAESVKLFKDKEFETSYLSFRVILSLLYLAVLLAEEPILLMDIIRWCREGHIPYMSAHNLLNADQSISLRWPHKDPAASKIRKCTADLLLILNITSVPMPPIKAVMDRMIALLKLPETVGALAFGILKKAVFEVDRSPPVIGIECFALAAIIVVLKAYWGINDLDEIHLSRIISKLNKEDKYKTTPLFNWDHWQRYMNKLLWFCGEIDPVVRLHCRNFVDFTRVNSEDYAKHLWGEGIWRIGSQLSSKDRAIYGLIEKVLDKQNSSLTTVLNQPMICEATKEPFYSILEQYIKAHRFDVEYEAEVETSNKLLEVSFASHVFCQSTVSNLEEELKEYKASIADNNVSVSRETESPEDSFIHVPHPLENLCLSKILRLERGVLGKSSSESLHWLISICCLFCEAHFLDLLEPIVIIEKMYPINTK